MPRLSVAKAESTLDACQSRFRIGIRLVYSRPLKFVFVCLAGADGAVGGAGAGGAAEANTR